MMRPGYLYHYGCLSSNLSRKVDRTLKGRFAEILLNDKLYFSQPVGFNDPFDCHYIPELTQRCVDELMQDKSLTRYPAVKQEKLLHKINQDYQSQLREEDNKNTICNRLRTYIRKHYGIVCFSELNDSIPMFAYYAGGHTGFCLKFAVNQAELFGRVQQVQYATAFPQLIVDNPGTKEIVSVMLATKCQVWAHEKEWRIILAPDELPNDRKVQFPPASLTGVILGCTISKQDKAFVTEVLRQRKAALQLYQAKPATGRYAIDIATQINY